MEDNKNKSKYICNFSEQINKVKAMGIEKAYSDMKSIEIPYRNLYIDAFGTTYGANLNDKYKDVLFRLKYDDGTTHDVGKLIGGTFRNLSCVTMFSFRFENEDGVTIFDTEYDQPTIIMLNEPDSCCAGGGE